MTAFRRFWRQTCRHYRNFQIAYTLLAIQFAVPALCYAIAPEMALEQYARLNAVLGGAPYTVPEEASHLWRYLGTVHVAALAFMCVYLQRNLRDRRPVLAPLLFSKGTTGTLWLAGFVASPRYPVLAVASLFDYLTCLILVGFAGLARAEIDTVADEMLVPRPTPSHPLGWMHFETRWAAALLEAMMSPRPESSLPSYDAPDIADFWDELRQHAPLQMKIALRAAVWVLTFSPLWYGTLRIFPHLSEEQRDEVLQRLMDSDAFVLRQLVSALRMAATFSYVRRPEVRHSITGEPDETLTYDQVPPESESHSSSPPSD